MEISWKNWKSLLSKVDTLNDLNMLAYQLEPLCPSQNEWAKFCTAVIALKWAKEFVQQSQEFVQDESAVMLALMDNYFHAAVQLKLGKAKPTLPCIAWAAYNKNCYKGYLDEIATVRFLVWAGFDADAVDSNGCTALHYMASWRNSPYSNPRAVKVLLSVGANPNIRNSKGDTPLTYLSGNLGWTAELDESARQLLHAGADPREPAIDGATAFNLLAEKDGARPDKLRGALMAMIEKVDLEKVIKARQPPKKESAPRKKKPTRL